MTWRLIEQHIIQHAHPSSRARAHTHTHTHLVFKLADEELVLAHRRRKLERGLPRCHRLSVSLRRLLLRLLEIRLGFGGELRRRDELQLRVGKLILCLFVDDRMDVRNGTDLPDWTWAYSYRNIATLQKTREGVTRGGAALAGEGPFRAKTPVQNLRPAKQPRTDGAWR